MSSVECGPAPGMRRFAGVGDSVAEPAVTEADAPRDALMTRFGPLPIDADRQIRFRGGLPGFPQIEHFQLEPLPGIETDLMLLQAVDAEEIGFITLPLPADQSVLRPTDVAAAGRMLDIEPGELLVLAIVTLAETDKGIEKFLNLRAPLFIDARRKIGAQVVLADPSYPMRHRMAAGHA